MIGGEKNTRAYNNIRRSNICITWIPERKEKKTAIQKICKEIITGSFPKLAKDINIIADSGSPANPKQEKPREFQAQIHPISHLLVTNHNPSLPSYMGLSTANLLQLCITWGKKL